MRGASQYLPGGASGLPSLHSLRSTYLFLQPCAGQATHTAGTLNEMNAKQRRKHYRAVEAPLNELIAHEQAKRRLRGHPPLSTYDQRWIRLDARYGKTPEAAVADFTEVHEP